MSTTTDEYVAALAWWRALRLDQRASIKQRHNSDAWNTRAGYTINDETEPHFHAVIRDEWIRRGRPAPGQLIDRHRRWGTAG